MAIYVDVQDIRQHVKGAGNAPVPQIQEIMEEVESYVSAQLDIHPLPPNNPILRSIIRELTTSRIILDLLPITAENLSRAQMHEQRGFRQLRDAKTEGIAPRDNSLRDARSEVYTPRAEPFFTYDMFQP